MISTGAILLAGAHPWRSDCLECARARLLLPMLNEPLADHLLGWLRSGGATSVTMCVNEGAGAVQRHLRDGAALGMNVHYFVDRIPRGPAGCCRDASSFVAAGRYVVIESSAVPDVDLSDLLAAHECSGASATVVVHAVPHNGNGEVDTSPAGIYVLSAGALENVARTGYQDIKEELIPRLYRRGELVATYRAEQIAPRPRTLGGYLAAQAWLLARWQEKNLARRGYEWRDGICRHHSAQIAESCQLLGPVMVGPHVRIGAEAVVTGPTVIGRGSVIGRRSVVGRSVLWEGCTVGEEATLDLCVVCDGVSLPARGSRYRALCRGNGCFVNAHGGPHSCETAPCDRPACASATPDLVGLKS